MNSALDIFAKVSTNIITNEWKYSKVNIMKTLGILNSDFINYHSANDMSYENKRIIRSAKEHFEKVYLLDPSKISIYISPYKSEVRYYNNEKNIIPEVDAILIRRTRGFSEQIYDIIRSIDAFYPQIQLFDPAHSFDNPTSKVFSFIQRNAYFDQPETLLVLNPKTAFIPKTFPLPLIVKPTHGFKGRHIKKCNSYEQAINHIHKTVSISKDAKEYQSIGYGFLVQ